MSATEAELVEAARGGDRDALEELARRHQRFIYNVALRMVWNPEDAKDVTQEVLVKVITKLGAFRGESVFRTWVYRIAVNHVLTMKRRGSERSELSFEAYRERINACRDAELPAAEPEVLEKESKLACTTGMLLCLSREQRIVIVLSILGVDDVTGGEVLGVTRETFRKRLSRARHDLRSFMENQCGLVAPTNPCRCAKKTRAFIEAGVVDPRRLRFVDEHVQSVKAIVPETAEAVETWLRVFREQPFQKGPDLAASLHRLLDSIGGPA